MTKDSTNRYKSFTVDKSSCTHRKNVVLEHLSGYSRLCVNIWYPQNAGVLYAILPNGTLEYSTPKDRGGKIIGQRDH